MLKYLVELTTSQDIIYKYVSDSDLDLNKYVDLVMKNEKCPRRSIVKIVVTQLEVD